MTKKKYKYFSKMLIKKCNVILDLNLKINYLVLVGLGINTTGGLKSN